MKLSEQAKQKSISYLTAYRHWQRGLIKGEQLATGTIVVYEEKTGQQPTQQLAILDARVSNAENKTNLDTQLNRLRNYATAKG